MLPKMMICWQKYMLLVFSIADDRQFLHRVEVRTLVSVQHRLIK